MKKNFKTMKPEMQERYDNNIDLLKTIVDFCVENNLCVLRVDELLVLRFTISCNDIIWNKLKKRLKEDERFYQQPKAKKYKTMDPQIRVKNDKPGNDLARVSVEYTWEKWKGDKYCTDAAIMRLKVLVGRSFAGNKEYKQKVIDILKPIYPNAENLSYD